MDEFLARLRQPILERIISLLPEDISVYLVGGAIRDALLGRSGFDLDFVTPGDAMKLARKLADNLGAAYFPLDSVRNVARIILKTNDGVEVSGVRTIKVDISKFQGTDLTSDLQGRDFTVNAMAVNVRMLDVLVDPLHGAEDLLSKRLRACSSSALLDDPIRILRAVRFAVDLDFRIMPETLNLMGSAIPLLSTVSAERVRDELFRMLTLLHPSKSLRILDRIGALELVLPEVCVLKDVKQSSPHVMDVWDHSLDFLKRLEGLLEVLAPEYDPDKAGNLSLGLAVLQLGRYRQQLAEHLESSLNPDRPHRGLLFLAGLYHDVGKLATQTIDKNGKIQFLRHDQIGGRIAEKRGQALKLSNLEITRLVTIVSHHMRPSLLSHVEEPLTKKAVYHFFRDTGAAGVDICLLSMADVLATYGPTLPVERWARHLEVVRTLLGAWWEDNGERVLPPPVINGNDLQDEFSLPPGSLIGYLLESIREAQVSGEVHDRSEAINLARSILKGNLNNKRAE